MKALNSAGCFEFWVCNPIGYTRCVTDEHEMRWKTRITWKQDNSETQNVNRIVKNITYSDIPNINIVQNYEFEDEKIEMQQPQIHLYLSVIIVATVSVMCSQTVTVLFLSSSRENGGPWSLTLHSHSFPLRLSSSQTQRSHDDEEEVMKWHLFLWFGACLCVWMRACVCVEICTFECVHVQRLCAWARATAEGRAMERDAWPRQIGLKMLERQWVSCRGVFSTQWTGQNSNRPLERRKTIKAVNSLGKCQRELYPHCKWEYSACQVILIRCGRPVATMSGKTWKRGEEDMTRKKPDNVLFFT